jgi:uncharacterized protein (TIGR03435 family)
VPSFKTLFLLASCCATAIGQEAAPAFEVASIKPSSRPGISRPEMDGAQYRLNGATVGQLLEKAYGVMEVQVVGPGWLYAGLGAGDRFDILAKIPESAAHDRLHMVPLMLQTLLKERFKLEAHRDQKSLQVYALIVGSNGPTMKAEAPDDPTVPGCVSAFVAGGPNAIQCHISMADFARELESHMQEGVPVVDRTGLTGLYDFKFSWTGRVMLELMHQGGVRIHDAVQQQLGLKLQGRKEMIDVLVVDHCEKAPTGN